MALFKKPRITVGKPKVTVGKPKVTVGKPKVTVGKPKVTVDKPKITVGNPKVTIGTPEIKVSTPKFPIIPVEKGAKIVQNISNEIIIKPAENISRETKVFIHNTGKEIERGWENGTIQTVAIAVASYYVGGPWVFQLAGWQQVAGALVVTTVYAKLANDDNNKVAKATEKAIGDFVQEGNKAVEPIIEEIKEKICSSIRFKQENCHFNFFVATEYDNELTIGLGEDYKQYLNYYRETYKNSSLFNQSIPQLRDDHLATIQKAIEDKTTEPILHKLIECSNQYFITMVLTSDLLSKRIWSDLETKNLLDMYNNASNNYKAINYIFNTKNFDLKTISNYNIKDIVSQWIIEKDGNSYLHHERLSTYQEVQTALDYNRAPASLKYAVLGGIFLGATILNNTYQAYKVADNIDYYRDLIQEMDLADRTKYEPVNKALFNLRVNNAIKLLEKNSKAVPDVINLYVTVIQGKLPKKQALDLLRSLINSDFEKQAAELEKIVKESELDKD